MPVADAADIGRPVPSLLEIQVLNKFKRFDKAYAEDQKREYPHLVKPAPAIGAAGTGAVGWVGLNADPCKAKYLAKCGIVADTADDSAVKKKKKGKEEPEKLLKTSFDLSKFMSTAPLPYPHWQGELHGPFERPKTEGSLSRTRSAPGTAVGSDVKSRYSKLTGASSALTDATRASVAKYVSEEVKRELAKMSCHEHYLEQKYVIPGAPCMDKTAPTPSDLNELLYRGVSSDLQGRHTYLDKRHRIMPQERKEPTTGLLSREPTTSAGEVGWQAYAGKGKFVGKMLKRMQPPPDTICIN